MDNIVSYQIFHCEWNVLYSAVQVLALLLYCQL